MPTPVAHFAVAVPIAMVLLMGAGCAPSNPPEIAESRLLMGTTVEVRIEDLDPARARAAMEAAYREMARLAQTMNHYEAGSVVSEINRQAGRAPVAVPPALMEVLDMAQALARRTHGAFDVTIGGIRGWRFDSAAPLMPPPAAITAGRQLVDYRRLKLDRQSQTAFLQKADMHLDLGGIAKLYILSAGMQCLQQRGVERALINGGGDIVAIGGETQPWRIGIRHPRAEGLTGVVELARGFVVSSGDYERFFFRAGERYHHILDPRTGYPARGVQHVTVIGESLQAVNGVSAAAMVLGAQAGRELIERTPGLAGYIVAADGTSWASSDFKLTQSD